MFGYTIIRREALDDLHVQIGSLEDRVAQRDRIIDRQHEEITGLTQELAETKQRLEKIKGEHDALVGLCYEPSSPESQRANGFSASVSDVPYVAIPPSSVPDATGNSVEPELDRHQGS